MALKNEVAVVFSDAGGVLFDAFIKQYDRISNLLTARGYPPSHIDAAIDRCAQQQLRFFAAEACLKGRHLHGTS